MQDSQEMFMPFVSATAPLGSHSDDWRSEGTPRLAKQICHVSRFLHGLQVEMRYGGLTRAPLQLLRFQMLAETVECDWLARAPDPWDADLSQGIRQRHESLQTLRDAIDVRALLFGTLPHVSTAYLHVYRESASYTREMVITGYAQRSDSAFRSIHSLAMRAKVLGFHFHLEDNSLHRIPTEGQLCIRN
jgi:hypothetical protein